MQYLQTFFTSEFLISNLMSLEKAIKYGKEKRKKYYGSKAFDHSCRNHGSCKWCEGNRTYKNKKREQASVLDLY